ncbi:MAG: tol-pal system YbgF family protein [bacterium]
MFKNNLTAKVTSFILLAGALGAGLPLAAKNGHSSTNGSDFSLFQNNEYDIEKAVKASEELLNSQPNSEFAGSVMFQLVELYYQRSSDQLQNKMAEYEDNLLRFEKGELKTEPVMPRVSYRDAISMGYRVLDEFPTAPFIDKIIYRMAICHLQEGNAEQAIAYFLRLTNEYKTSSYVDEANFRVGEQYFERRKYHEAIEFYNRLLNSWESPFFDMALYKLAWSYYNIDNHSKAISTFIFLIDDLSQVEKTNVDAEGVSNADLREEAVSYVAESFAEHGGAKAAERFLIGIFMTNRMRPTG